MATLYHKPKPATAARTTTIPWLKVIINTVILGSLAYLVVSFYPVASIELGYYFRQWTAQADDYAKTPTVPAPSATFGDLLSEGPTLPQPPVNTDFSVIIPKIDVNTPIVPDVDPGDKKAYLDALNRGAAHAKGTVKPGEVGNSYIFAHSTANPLNIEKYAAVFTLLGKLNIGDRITTFYQGKRYDYAIDQKYVVDFNNVTPLTATYDHPVLTLQTCDPPGTEFHRLILVAHLIGTYSK
jgi:LPXTG-site transpeptidase (sortase) family protein